MKIVVHRDQPREEWRPGVETRMHVSAANGATGLCIFEQWVAPTAGAPTHRHTVEEVLTVIAGEAEMWIDEQQSSSSDGQSLIVPARPPARLPKCRPGCASLASRARRADPRGYVR